jgi:hypothetical protein
MALFGKKNEGGLLDVIRCDEETCLIWKWRPAGADVNESKKENAIRWGSSLRVKNGEVAVFVYKQKDGAMQDFIEETLRIQRKEAQRAQKLQTGGANFVIRAP